jgi:predicted TIM-barrel fold metal-dependent hydrolase
VERRRFILAVALVPRSDAEVGPYLDSLGLPGIIDLHVHFMPSRVLEKVWAFFDRVADSGAPAWPIAYRDSEEERVRTLRDIGVKAFTTLNYAHRPGMAQWLNDYSAAFASRHADAIHSATFYPEPGVETVVADSLKRGARIFKVHIQVGGFSPLDPQLAPAWELIQDSGTPVVIHCGSGPHPGEFTGPEPVRELVKRYPSLVLIIAHAGLPEYQEYAELAANNPHVYLDTTMVGTSYMEQVAPIPPGYLDTLAGLSHKVVLGTDFPSIPYSYSHQIQVLEGWGLGSQWMKNVLWHTPQTLLGLDRLP